MVLYENKTTSGPHNFNVWDKEHNILRENMFVTYIEVSKYSITKTTQVWQLYPSLKTAKAKHETTMRTDI